MARTWTARAALLAGVAALLLSPPHLPAQRPTTAAPLRGFDRYVAQALKDWGVPGVAVAVVKDDSVVFVRGFGVRRLGDSAAVTARTLFAIGSCTKAFTAAALALLADSGKLSWDDPATKYLKGFELYDPYASRELTVRDLLSHRSGLARGDALWYATPYDREEVLRRVRHLKPSWSFRSTYGYQNIMFLAAGQLVPAVTGETWDEFVRRRIFAPLGMRASVTSMTRLPAEGDVAGPHDRVDGEMRPIAWRNIDNIGPAGSINSNVTEMAEWVRLQLGGGVYRGQRLLSAASMREMHAPQTIIPLDTLTERLRPSTHFLAYGLGWSVYDYRGRKIVSHGGAIDGFRAQVGLVPEEHLGIVVLANGGEPSRLLTSALQLRVIDLFLGGAPPPRDWSAALLQVRQDLLARGRAEEEKQARERVSGTNPSLPLPQFAGSYRSEMYGDLIVALEDSALVLHHGPSYAGELRHWHYDTFQARWRDRTMGEDLISFALGPDGKVVRLTWPGLGDFDRVAAAETRAGR